MRYFAESAEFKLGNFLARGGEGEVYEVLDRPDLLFKRYLPEIHHKREPKIEAMIKSGLAGKAPDVSFPLRSVRDQSGNFVGFLMRYVDKCKEVHELQTPVSRQKYFPKADYRFIVRVAVNLARVFAQIHDAECVVGDINPKGILVSKAATVTLIDADSFQFTTGRETFFCEVGVLEYTPPELQGQSLQGKLRTIDNDCFGLAVCVFHLLCMDRHPFSGRYLGKGEMPLEKAISNYLYAYSAQNNLMKPPPGAIHPSEISAEINEFFERAFSSQYQGRRPTAKQWIGALSALDTSLRICTSNKLHHFSNTVSECPWCRMERHFGRALFFSFTSEEIQIPAGRVDPNGGLAIDLEKLLSSISKIQIPNEINIDARKPQQRLTPSDWAIQEKRKQLLGPLRRISSVLIGIAGLYLWLNQPNHEVFALVAAGLCIGLFYNSSFDKSQITIRYFSVAAKVKERIVQLQDQSPVIELVRKRNVALAAIEDFSTSVRVFKNIPADYERNRRQDQLDRFLESFDIRKSSIPKVSPGDISSLVSFGVSNALDASKHNLEDIYGIGPVKSSNILYWVKSKSAEFVYKAAYTSADQSNLKRLQAAHIRTQRDIELRISEAIGELNSEAQRCEVWRQAKDTELEKLCLELAQREADLAHLGLPIPTWPTVMPKGIDHGVVVHRPSVQIRNFNVNPQTQGTPACPSCGSLMIKRVARHGYRRGRQFWGCSRYPACTGTRNV